jgi:hypothetical protein
MEDEEKDEDKPGDNEEPKATIQLGNPPETGRADKPRDRGDI